MEYVNRSQCPQLLIDNQIQWTQAWVAHYDWDKSNNEPRPEKPTDSHWLEEDIRDVLFNDFHHCCGYCGRVTPLGDPEQNNRKFGQVDHYKPKSKRPQLVYDWDNFIWCCENCNSLKGTFLDEAAPLFNPCTQTDCQMIQFNSSDGKYELIKALKSNKNAIKRLTNQHQKTLHNNSDIALERRDLFTAIDGAFCTLNYHLKTNLIDGVDNNISSELLDICPPNTEVIDKNTNTIQTWLCARSFHLLRQKIYLQMTERYPLAAEHLANNDIGI